MLKIDVPALKEHLEKLCVFLAYHTDLQGIGHLAVIKENKEGNQRGSFLYPGEQMDLYDSTPEVRDDWYFTPVNLDTQFDKIRDDFAVLISLIDTSAKRL
ncbi:MAG TPA: hypothetical protein VFI61_00495 [Patescibacteria group bacterium]|nr:hypothetical protein [Patescibacteria group bacterium]